MPLSLVCTLLLSLLPARADWLDQASERIQSGDLDGAIAVAEARTQEAPQDVVAWRFVAEAFERLAKERQNPLLNSNAARAWEQVAANSPEDDAALISAARARLSSREFDRAEANALGALGIQLADSGQAQPATVALALRARMGAFEDAPWENADRYALELRDVADRISEARELTGGAPEIILAEAAWYESLHMADRAAETLRAGVGAFPASQELHAAWIELHARRAAEDELLARYDDLTTRYPDNATVHWYAGLAARTAGDAAARERRNVQAALGYERCIAHMQRARELDPDFEDTAQWVAIQARTGLGWSALDADDVETAARTWMTLLDERPDQVQLIDGLGRTPEQGLGRLGGRFHVRDQLDAAEQVSRELANVTDQAWWWNNVGYLNRERAADAERSDEPGSFDRARSIYETSWKAYQRAANLAADNARIVNDTALIQIYHLRSDLEGAERMLREAIRMGEAQLAELGPEADEEARFPIAQAVGDAYQNLGFLYQRLRNEPERARVALQKSLDTNSGVRRVVRAALDEIENGTSEPLETRPTPQQPAQPAQTEPKVDKHDPQIFDNPLAPSPEFDERGLNLKAGEEQNINWERSIEAALAASRADGHPVIVYHRVGNGLGPSVEYLQRYLHSDEFARSTRGAITILADRLRHTFDDRDSAGRLVPCPRSSGLTCAEHMACADEFERRWRAQHGTPPGRDSNGLFLLTDTSVERIGQIQDVFERFRPLEVSAEDTGAKVHNPARPARGLGAMADSVRHVDRRALEEVVFSGPSPERRRAALVAIATSRGAENDDLLRAVISQRADEELARWGLAYWPRDLGPELPLRVVETTPFDSVRRAALMALRNFESSDLLAALVARWTLAGATDEALPARRVRELARLLAER